MHTLPAEFCESGKLTHVLSTSRNKARLSPQEHRPLCFPARSSLTSLPPGTFPLGAGSCQSSKSRRDFSENNLNQTWGASQVCWGEFSKFLRQLGKVFAREFSKTAVKGFSALMPVVPPPSKNEVLKPTALNNGRRYNHAERLAVVFFIKLQSLCLHISAIPRPESLAWSFELAMQAVLFRS